jgi:fructose-1-phosphate kinase PfkB-like protein
MSQRALVITCNAGIDRVLRVPKLQPGSIYRSPSAKVTAGGKGINVSRALKCISQIHATNSGVLAGFPGRYVQHLAETEGLSGDWFWLPESDDNVSRTCVLISHDDHDSTVLNEEGPYMDQQEWTNFSQHITDIAQDFQIIIFAGSMLRGIEPYQVASLTNGMKILKYTNFQF